MRALRLLPAALAGVGAVLVFANGCLVPVKSARGDTPEAAADRSFLADAVIGNWWPVSASAARGMIERYGVPDEVRPEHLVWNANGPWKRTVVRNVTPLHGPVSDVGVVEQTVRYPLTPAQLGELKSYDRRLGYERGLGELGARSDREEINYLRLNLADDIVNGRMTAAQARHLHGRVLELENAGKESPYLKGLRFTPDAD